MYTPIHFLDNAWGKAMNTRTLRALPFLLLAALTFSSAAGDSFQFTTRAQKPRFSTADRVVISFEIRNDSPRDVFVPESIGIPYDVSVEVRGPNNEDIALSGVVPSLGPVKKFQLLRAGAKLMGTMTLPRNCGAELATGGFCLSKPGKYRVVATFLGLSSGVHTCPCAFPGKMQAAPFEFWID